MQNGHRTYEYGLGEWTANTVYMKYLTISFSMSLDKIEVTEIGRYSG